MVQRDLGMSHARSYIRTPGHHSGGHLPGSHGQVPLGPGQGRERGHKPTPSQESNTLSEVSCYTTISTSSDIVQGDLRYSDDVQGDIRSGDISGPRSDRSPNLEMVYSESLATLTPAFHYPNSDSR